MRCVPTLLYLITRVFIGTDCIRAGEHLRFILLVLPVRGLRVEEFRAGVGGRKDAAGIGGVCHHGLNRHRLHRAAVRVPA